MNHSGEVQDKQQMKSFQVRTGQDRADFLKSEFAAAVVVQYSKVYADRPHSSRNIYNNAMIQFLKEEIALAHATNYIQSNQSPHVKGYNVVMRSIWQSFDLSSHIESMVAIPWPEVCTK